MKKFFETSPDLALLSRLLVVAVLGLLGYTVYLGLQCISLRGQITAAAIEQQRLAGKREVDAQLQDQLNQQKDRLKKHEAKIPFVDGYIWLSKFMHGAAPGLQIAVDPPDLSAQDFVIAGDYSTGAFHVKGNGSIENFVNLLKTCEAELPFAHIRDLQFSFVDENKTRVQFNLILVLVTRLHDATVDASNTTLSTVALQ